MYWYKQAPYCVPFCGLGYWSLCQIWLKKDCQFPAYLCLSVSDEEKKMILTLIVYVLKLFNFSMTKY